MDNELLIPPLDERRFNGSFNHFCSVKQLPLDQGLLHVGGKKVELHSLHEAVMKHRGYAINKKGPDFWSELGTQLGFIKSQDTVPASSQIAGQLATIYERYLEEFDGIYVMSFNEEYEKRSKAYAKSAR